MSAKERCGIDDVCNEEKCFRKRSYMCRPRVLRECGFFKTLGVVGCRGETTQAAEASRGQIMRTLSSC